MTATVEGRRSPTAGRRLLAAWKRVGMRIGDVQARILLTIFYFLVLGPFALVLRLAADPLALKRGTPRGWRPRRAPEEVSVSRASRQF